MIDTAQENPKLAKQKIALPLLKRNIPTSRQKQLPSSLPSTRITGGLNKTPKPSMKCYVPLRESLMSLQGEVLHPTLRPSCSATTLANMTHYKGRQNAKAVERDFPQFVDIVVPLGGLGARLDAMYDFHVSTASNRNAARVNMTPTAALFGGALLISL
ncbi:MAG: hypothetical protein WBX05_14205 [Pseudolabrys sp.]